MILWMLSLEVSRRFLMWRMLSLEASRRFLLSPFCDPSVLIELLRWQASRTCDHLC
jgi:hypothetical protein